MPLAFYNEFKGFESAIFIGGECRISLYNYRHFDKKIEGFNDERKGCFGSIISLLKLLKSLMVRKMF
jgi:hypothetical protein